MPETAAKDTPEQAEFREYCRTWLAENHPGRSPVRLPLTVAELTDRDALRWLQDWQKAAYEAGLVGCDYPAAFGGGGHENFQLVANEEMLRAMTPYFPNAIGLGMAAPTMLFHASDEVKGELLPPLFSSDHMWCQGFSEPGAGSDLANQQTFAERDGDAWVVNGHKVWTSLGHFADWMILLCRTSRDDKYKGLTYFVVPIEENRDKGVTVRPLIKMTGETGFNEVLFDDVVIPDRYRLDAVGEGWQVAMTTLLHERGGGSLVRPDGGGMPLEVDDDTDTTRVASLIDLARSHPRGGAFASDDPLIRDELMKLLIREHGFEQNERRANVAALTDHPMRIPLQHKLVYSEIHQDLRQLAYGVEGAHSTLYANDPLAPAKGQWTLGYMNSFGTTIAGGANEVQRNIIGERVLGLPKSK